ncbi:hypothetical protein TNCV_4236781 [Trichonephila clavipes]|nr:hypothetical protein TNCV_4236781 [Trichonephila clavipes]
MPNFIKGFGYVQKKYTRGLVLGKATVNQLRYSEQLMNCRALGSKTALLRNNKIKSSAVLIQALQKHKFVYFAQTRKFQNLNDYGLVHVLISHPWERPYGEALTMDTMGRERHRRNSLTSSGDDDH